MGEDRLIQLTKKLISFKTVTGDGNKTNLAMNFVCGYLKGLDIKKYQSNGYMSLAISNTSQKGKIYDIIFHGHIDVVPAGSNEDYRPYIKSGKIFGRGALDMKGGLACLIEFMKNNKNNKKKLLLLITSDEEIGGQNGTEYLLKKVGYRGRFFLTAEGEKQYLIKRRQKGIVMVRLKSTGKGDHSAYVWKGENAINKLYSAYSQIEKLFPYKKNNTSHWYTTINLGKIYGGLAANSIPNYAEAELDIRFCHPWKSYKEVFSAIKKIVAKNNGVTAEIKYAADMMTSDINDPYISTINDVAKKILNLNKNIYFDNHGTNDARFAAQLKIPAIGFGPIGNNYHAEKEYVDIQSLHTYYLILDKFISSIK